MISRSKSTGFIIIILLLITSISAHAQLAPYTDYISYPSYNSYYPLYGFDPLYSLGNTYVGYRVGISGGYGGYNWNQPYYGWNMPYNYGWNQSYGWGSSFYGWIQPYAYYNYGLPFFGFPKPSIVKPSKPVIPPEPPKQPKNLQISHVTDSSVSLIWEDRSDNEVQFRIERKTGDSGDWALIDTVGQNVTTYVDIDDVGSPVEYGEIYYYRVSADTSDYSNFTEAVAPGKQQAIRHAFVANHEAGLTILDVSDPENPTFVGSYDNEGGVGYVFVAGNYAYLCTASPNRLDIVDVSDPANPRLEGYYDMPDVARGVDVVGNYAYVTASSAGLQIIDVSNPNAPVFVGCYDTPGNAWVDIQVLGNYAYVPDSEAGLLIIDISKPDSPSLIGDYDTTYLSTLFIRGNYAYLNEWNDGFHVLDISNPAAPSEVYSYDIGQCQGIDVVGDYAYALFYNHSLEIFDVSNPLSIQHINSFYHPYRPCPLDVFEDYAYTGDGYDNRVTVIDVSNPASPTVKGSYLTTGWVWRVFVKYCLVSNFPNAPSHLHLRPSADHIVLSWQDNSNNELGFRIERSEDGLDGTYVQIYDTMASNVQTYTDTGLAVDKEYCYRIKTYNAEEESIYSDALCVTTHPEPPKQPKNLQISHVTDSSVSLIWEDHSDNEVQFRIERKTGDSGDWALIDTVGQNVTTYVDIDDVGSPVEYGEIYYYRVSADTSDYSNVTEAVAPGQQQAVLYAFVANAEAGLTILDVSNPENPTFVGSYDNTGDAGGIFVAGNYAYVGTGSPDSPDRIDIIDVSDPANPRLEGYYNMPDRGCGVDLVGNYAYATGYAEGGLQIIDVSNPASPVFVGWYDTPGNAFKEVEVHNDYAYVSDSEAGLQIIDVSNPESPTLIGNYDTPSSLIKLFVHGNYIYLDDFNSGFHVLDISNPVSPSEVYSYDIGQSQGIDVVGDYAYVPFYNHSLEIFDVSDPLNIHHIESFYHPYRPCYIDVFEDYAYTGDGYDKRVTVIDVSNPASPSVKGSYLTTRWVWGVFVKYCLLCTEPLEAPSDLYFSGTTSDSATLIWIDNSGIEQGFKIYRDANYSGIFAELAEVSRDVTSYTDTGLSLDTNYCYKVKAYNACGESEWSNILCAAK